MDGFEKADDLLPLKDSLQRQKYERSDLKSGFPKNC